MLKATLTVLVTAMVCFAIAAATGMAARSAQERTISMRVGDLVLLRTANVGCRALNKTTVACGENKIANTVAAYLTPTQLNVVKFNAAGTKASLLYQVKR